MLDKLNLNKISYFFLLIVVASCNIFGGKKAFFDTEILCPGRERILVRYARLEEIKAAIAKANYDKQFYRTSENYTVIRLPGNRSFKIDKISPEEALGCALRESPRGYVDQSYVKAYDAGFVRGK